MHRSILLLCALDAALLAYPAWHLDVTADEPSHFAAAQQYWLGNDVLEPSDTPPLMRILCGWIPVAMSAPVDRTSHAWIHRDAYGIGAETLGKPDAALAAYKLNTAEHPKSGDAFDDLGGAYLKRGDKKLAIDSYLTAVSLDSTNTNAVKQLESLKVSKSKIAKAQQHKQ